MIFYNYSNNIVRLRSNTYKYFIHDFFALPISFLESKNALEYLFLTYHNHNNLFLKQIGNWSKNIANILLVTYPKWGERGVFRGGSEHDV